MPDRITIKQLHGLCDTINRVQGLPLTPYRKNADGTYSPNANVYHIGQRYGGCSLDRMSSTDGCTGISCIIGTTTKRDLYYRMHAYLDGLMERAS